MPEIEVGVVGKVVAGVDGGGSGYGIGGERAPMVDRRQGAVGELRESEAELLTGSAWAERVWRGGSTVSSSSSELGWAAAVFWRFGAGSWRKSERNRMRGCSGC